MISGGKLVLKLPHDRVDTLIGSGAVRPFDAGKGGAMRSDSPPSPVPER
jgi:hypothetical protein